MSLIELIIVMAIIAIITAFAVPYYQHHLRKGYRQQAQMVLLEGAHALQRYYHTHHSYEQASLAQLGLNASIAQGHYQLTLSHVSDTTFTLTATPNTQQQKDACGTLAINQLLQTTHC